MKPFRAKCPNCGVVFEEPRHLTLVHVMSTKLLTCPACGKSAMMPTDVKDPVTWPAQQDAPAADS
jgi:ribosomal protein S27AE